MVSSRWRAGNLSPSVAILAAAIGLSLVGLVLVVGYSEETNRPVSKPASMHAAEISGADEGLQMSFEPNVGQTDGQAEFLSRGRGYSLHLTSSLAVLSRRGSVVRMSFPGSNANPEVSGIGPLDARSNYLTGNDPARWHTGVPHYSRVRYSDLYPGIDLVFYGRDGELEYDFIVSPGADSSVIRLELEGADDLTLDHAGNLVLALPPRPDETNVVAARDELILQAPVVYQELDGGRISVDGEFAVEGNARVGFQIGSYDNSLPLIIDPVLIYSTFLGGNEEENAKGVVVDRDGYAYVVGIAESVDFPTKAALDPTLGGNQDAFITKLTPDGSAMIFSTFFGGSAHDNGKEIALDNAGNIFVVGNTRSSDFPTANAVDGSKTGSEFSEDIFITKLNPAASALIFSTYLGGAEDEYRGGLALDSKGNAYVSGQTYSSDFPTANAWQPSFAGPAMSQDAFVAKLPPSGKPLAYSTYLGGADERESSNDVAVDAAGNAYVTGFTWSSDFPTLNALKPVSSNIWSASDAFLTKLNTTGTVLYSTYFGGDDGGEEGYGIVVDFMGNTYVTGMTSSSDFPTKNAYQGTEPGNADAFVSKLTPDGSAIIQSTFLGGTENIEIAYGMAVDRFGGVYVTGRTDSSDFPTVTPFDGDRSSDSDAFFARLSPDGTQLMYSTYLGGASGFERGFGVTVGEKGNVYVVGYTWSTDFPTYRALQPTNQGASNAWIMSWQWPANFWLAAAPLPDVEKAGEDNGGEH